MYICQSLHCSLLFFFYKTQWNNYDLFVIVHIILKFYEISPDGIEWPNLFTGRWFLVDLLAIGWLSSIKSYVSSPTLLSCTSSTVVDFSSSLLFSPTGLTTLKWVTLRVMVRLPFRAVAVATFLSTIVSRSGLNLGDNLLFGFCLQITMSPSLILDVLVFFLAL
jgi:hypothetical protein